MFDGSYIERTRAISKAIVDNIGHPFFSGKSLIDLGCGHADLSATFYRLGAKVLAVDARPEHLKVASKKYPGIKTQRLDLDKEFPFRSTDFVLAIDILCRLKNWEAFLRNICNSASHFVLETAVMDSDDPNAVSSFAENKNVYDASFSGFASVPTTAYIERVMDECGVEYKRIDQAKINNGTRKYDWKVGNTNSCDANVYRRFWICSKRQQTTVSKAPQPIVGNPKYLMPGVMLTPPVPIPLPPSQELPNIAMPTYPDPLRIDLAGQPRIAVCISGNLRTFEKTMASFKHFILGNLNDNTDYFIHCWDTIGARTVPYDSALARIQTQAKMSDIERIFKPKKISIESSLDSSVMRVIHERASQAKIRREDYAMFRNNTLNDYFSMLYSWKRSKDLLEEYEKEKGIRYDIVIKHRSDLLFKTPFDVKRGLNKMCVPMIGNCYRGAMNDMFAIGMHDQMMTYLSLFDSVVGYLNGRECIFRPEWLIRHHLNKNGIVFAEEQINYGVLRPDNNFQGLSRA